jgi:hypothetical protein
LLTYLSVAPTATDVYAAIADPTRRRILDRLAEQD